MSDNGPSGKDLSMPPTEIEIGQLYCAMREAGITESGMLIVRRLAFQRDALIQSSKETI